MAEVIQLLFTRTPGPFSLAIRWRTASPWSHVDVILPTNVTGREPHVIGALALRGMHRRPLADAIKWTTAYGIADVYGVPDEAAVYDYLFDHEGESYGWLEIAGFVLGRGIDSKQHICSEAVTRALQNGGKYLFDERPQLVTPRDLWITVPTERKLAYKRPHPWAQWGAAND